MVCILVIVSGLVSDEQIVVIGFVMNNLIYGNELKENKDWIKDIFKNCIIFDLNFYYELNNDSWRVYVGVNVDFFFENGKVVCVFLDVKV